MSDYLITLCKGVKAAAKAVSALSETQKNFALFAMANALSENRASIIAANKLDVTEAKSKGISSALLDRLTLNEKRIEAMAEGIKEVAALKDPIGETVSAWTRPNGIEIGQRRVPLGVIGIIYEARPNVTADAAALCLKTSNTVVLRGGSEAINSNKKIVEIMQSAIQKHGMPREAVSLVEDTSRETVTELMKQNGYIDVLIPRGGKGLISSVVKNATVPVIETGTGICHTYVDSGADLNMALEIVLNAKMSRPGVCNAMETLLVAKEEADGFLPLFYNQTKDKLEYRCCPLSIKYFEGAKKAADEDYNTEYNDFIINIKVVKDMDEAISHIEKFGTKHSEAIITKDYSRGRRFVNEVDAAAVYINASTRFTDGFEFGFGAEIGISTQKIHARGPMGLLALTTIKYVVYGDGQIR